MRIKRVRNAIETCTYIVRTSKSVRREATTQKLIQRILVPGSCPQKFFGQPKITGVTVTLKKIMNALP